MTRKLSGRGGLRAVRRHRSTIVLATVVALVSSSTVAAASYLILGGPNTASATTTLRSGVNGAVLQVRNTRTSGNTAASGLGITVPAGRPPITVNATAGKATNLDADKLDGVDSTGFMGGAVTYVRETKTLLAGTFDSQTAVCPEGTNVLGGGIYSNDYTATVVGSHPTQVAGELAPDRWTGSVRAGATQTVIAVWAICAQAGSVH